MRPIRIYALLAIAFLSSCLPTTPSDMAPVRTETPDVDVPTDVVLVFRRSGGSAGIDEEWVIHRDGHVDVPRGDAWQADPAEIRSLLETIQASGFFALDDSYVPSDTCCDRFTYTVTVQYQGRIKTVSTIDGAPSQPDELLTVIDAVTALLPR